MLFEEQLECSFGESLCRSGGDLLEGCEIDIESGSVVSEGSFGDDFGPLLGEVVKFLKFLD